MFGPRSEPTFTPRQRPLTEMARLGANPFQPKPPPMDERKRKLWKALNTYISANNGWIVSLPDNPTIRFECSQDLTVCPTYSAAPGTMFGRRERTQGLFHRLFPKLAVSESLQAKSLLPAWSEYSNFACRHLIQSPRHEARGQPLLARRQQAGSADGALRRSMQSHHRRIQAGRGCGILRRTLDLPH